MRRKLLVSLILAATFAESIGCAGTKPVVRGQSPESRFEFTRFRRRIRRDIEPVLDATFNVGKKAEPAWDATKDVTKKGLLLGGMLALLGGAWWLSGAGCGPRVQLTLGSSTPPQSDWRYHSCLFLRFRGLAAKFLRMAMPFASRCSKSGRSLMGAISDADWPSRAIR